MGWLYFFDVKIISLILSGTIALISHTVIKYADPCSYLGKLGYYLETGRTDYINSSNDKIYSSKTSGTLGLLFGLFSSLFMYPKIKHCGNIISLITVLFRIFYSIKKKELSVFTFDE
jgi:hypothetical protein